MTDHQPAENAKFSAFRDTQGKFITTSGRPVGAKGRATKASASAIQSLHDVAFQKLAELLTAGHPGIVEFVVKSLLPTGGRVVQLDDLSADGLLDAVACGVISPAELRQIAAGIEKIRNVTELESMKERMVEIERLLRDE